MLTDEQRTEIQRLVESRFGELLQLQSEKEKTTAKILKGRVEGRKLLAVENISIETSDAPSSLEPLVRVIARAVEVLGTSEKALRWLNAPIRSLGDQTPASLLNTPEGIKRVEDALGRIEHGVWQVNVYRIGSSRHPTNDGMGASLYGGRWNHKGTPVIYSAASRALCALEVLANADELADDYISIAIEIPDDLSITSMSVADLPAGWDSNPSPDATRDIGTAWANGLATAVLSAPSAVIPRERNYILNPAHPDFGRIKFSSPEPFYFDDRLGRMWMK